MYYLTDVPPCRPNSIIHFGNLFYRVRQIEPLYYEFRKLASGSEIGFSTAVEPVSDLIPPKDTLYYITNFGINGRMKGQIRYQANSPRNTVGAKSSQYLDRYQAHYMQPFTFKFVVINGDTLEVDVVVDIPFTKGAFWFYGYKFRVMALSEPPAGEPVIELEDVRGLI